MSNNESDSGRLVDPYKSDKPSYGPAVMSQIGSGITHPKNAAETDGDSPDRKEGESSQ
ncbi:hypothetical protein [Halococcus sp. AFM35]|uniref:hypothetical protein n=1 Tax=Halococcus sp. AFM35 TaxID=3421653 RepID=UPI003EBAE1C5